MTLSLPSAGLSIAELDDLDHDGVVRFVRALEDNGHRMVWPEHTQGARETVGPLDEAKLDAYRALAADHRTAMEGTH